MKTAYIEEQRFTQWWLWLILIGCALIPFYGIYKQIIVGEQIGDKPISVMGLYVFAIFMLAFLAFFWLIRLKTEINHQEIILSFFPFTKKNVMWTDVKTAEIVDYGFIGGWGVRFSSSFGTVYNIAGSHGLAIKLKNGRKFCIGTQNQTELNKFIKGKGL